MNPTTRVQMDKDKSMSDYKIDSGQVTDKSGLKQIAISDSMDSSNHNRLLPTQVPLQKDSFKCPKLPSKSEKLTTEMASLDLNPNGASNEPVSTLRRIESSKENKHSKKYAQSKNKFISLTTLYIVSSALKCNDLIRECLRIWVEGGLDRFKVVSINVDENNQSQSNSDNLEKLAHILNSNSCESVGFLLNHFEGPIFDYLVGCRQFIVGPTFVTEYLTEYGVTPIKLMSCRPIYCSSMLKITVLFDGFDQADTSCTIRKLAKRVCFMGGHVGSMLDPCTITHLVTPSVFSNLYQEAMDLRVTVVQKEWIEHCWENRNELDYIASMDTVEGFEIKPFQGLCIAFVGFSTEEVYQLEEAAHLNGATVSMDTDDSNVTHIVCENKERFLNESKIHSIKLGYKTNFYSVNWFWRCIHMERYYTDDVAYLNATSRCDESSVPYDLTESITSMSNLVDCHIASNLMPINTNATNIVDFQLPCPDFGVVATGLNTNSAMEHQVDHWKFKHEMIDGVNCFNDDVDVTPIKTVSLKKQSTLTTDSKFRSSNVASNASSTKAYDVVNSDAADMQRTSENNSAATGTIADQCTVGNAHHLDTPKESNVSNSPSVINTTSSNNINSSIASSKPKIFNENVSVEVIKKMGSLVKFASISAHSPKFNIDNKIIEKRELIVDELIFTETNYVKVLKTVIDVFYRPLEKLVKSSNKPIISSKDLKFMFSAFPHIYNIHSNFLNDLVLMKRHMAFKHICVGTLMLDHIERYPKAYAPYVNYYDLIYNSIKEWSDSKPRFHAFLKSCEMDPRCHRETLQQLFIRPIQRLPSTLMLLNQIVDLVLPAEPDYKCLIKSIQILKDIVKSLNEGKRFLESKMRIFSIINNVERCPANIVSIGRDLVLKFEAVEKSCSKMFSKNGRYLVIYLLNDAVEIATKKLLKIISKSVINSAKQIMSNNSVQSSSTNVDAASYIDEVNNVRSDKDKPFKHYLYLELKDIHSIYNIVPNNNNCSISKQRDMDYSSETVHHHSAPTTPSITAVSAPSSNITSSYFSSNVQSNILGLLYYVDRFHYNFIYFKIHGKNAAADKELFIRELASKIARHRNLESYQQAIVESSNLISTKDDLVFATDDNSASDLTFNDDTSVGGNGIPLRVSSGSMTNLQSPFHGINSNMSRLTDVVGSSTQSIISGGNMVKLKKAKKYGSNSKGLFSTTANKKKILERSCSTACSSKYSKKKLSTSTTTFSNSQQDRESTQTDESSTNNDHIPSKKNKKRDSISTTNTSSRFSFNFGSWKRTSGFGLLGRKEHKPRPSIGDRSIQNELINDSTDHSDSLDTLRNRNSVDFSRITPETPPKKFT